MGRTGYDGVEGGGKESSEPMAWDLSDIASAERKRSNDRELGRQSHSKKLLCAKVVLRMGA